MEAVLILADRILTLVRESGATKMEASAALAIAGSALPTVKDMSFRDDLEDIRPGVIASEGS